MYTLKNGEKLTPILTFEDFRERSGAQTSKKTQKQAIFTPKNGCKPINTHVSSYRKDSIKALE
jgi:hypothetical protein